MMAARIRHSLDSQFIRHACRTHRMRQSGREMRLYGRGARYAGAGCGVQAVWLSGSAVGASAGGRVPAVGQAGSRGHGSGYFDCSVPTVLAGPERVRRGGFPFRRAAEAACAELVARSAEDATAETWTVGRWLVSWLSTRTSMRPTTLRSYTEHVQRHLIPYLGRIRPAELTGRDVAAMFAVLSETPGTCSRPTAGSRCTRTI